MSTDPLHDLESALDRWGGELTRWPAQEARWARELLERSPAARALKEQALALERDLRALPAAPLPSPARTRLLERARRDRPPSAAAPAGSLATHLWRGALAACLPLLAGYLVGVSSAYSEDARYADAVSQLAFTASFEDNR